MPLKTREPIKVSYVGQAYAGNSVTMTPRALAPSYADQVLLGVDDGTTTYIYVYDPNYDSLSQLDQYTIATYGTLRALATFKAKRIAFCAASASSTVNILYWKHDYDTATGNWTYVSPIYNFDFPFDEKALFGFQVVQDPTVLAGIDVYDQLDEDGTWTLAGSTNVIPTQNQKDAESAFGGNDFSAIQGASISRTTTAGQFSTGVAGVKIVASNVNTDSGVTVGASASTTLVTPVTAGLSYVFAADIKGNGANPAYIRARWLDSSGTFISNSDMTPFNTNAAAFDRKTYTVTAPSTAAYVRYEILFSNAGNTQEMYV